MATANRKKLHKHFIRGRDPTAPVGDGAPSLLQQVTAGQKGSWEEEGRDRERGGDNTVGLLKQREKPFPSPRFIQQVVSLQFPSSYRFLRRPLTLL